MAHETPSLIEVGYVTRPHGVRGELRVVTHDPESTTLLEVEVVHLGDQPYRVLSARAAHGAILLRLTDIRDRNQAEALRGRPVCVDRSLVPMEEDEVFLVDLVGCEAVLADGTSYGTIVAIDAGPQDRLVIHQGDVERLLPVVPVFIESVDVEAGRVVVAPPEELPESPIPEPPPGRR